MISIIMLVLNLLANLLESAKIGGAAPEVIAAIEAAIENLNKVKGSPVSFQQLEDLRVKPQW